MISELENIFAYTLFKFKDFNFTVADLLLFFFILFITEAIHRSVRFIIRSNFKRKDVTDAGKEYALIKISKYFIYTIGLVVAIESLGINISILLASSAALFVGIGLGLQQIFNDFVSGFILLFEGEIRKGDIIELNGNIGQIEQLDIRTTKIRTRDDIVIVVPNSKLTSNDIVNWSHSGDITRFGIQIGVAYGSDLQLVKKILEETTRSHPDVIVNKPIIVRFNDFADSSLAFEIFFWAKRTWEIEIIKSDIRFLIDDAFRKNNISIPFPQRDIHIRKN